MLVLTWRAGIWARNALIPKRADILSGFVVSGMEWRGFGVVSVEVQWKL
jgi:hypothetical protein